MVTLLEIKDPEECQIIGPTVAMDGPVLIIAHGSIGGMVSLSISVDDSDFVELSHIAIRAAGPTVLQLPGKYNLRATFLAGAFNHRNDFVLTANQGKILKTQKKEVEVTA